ncbi:hypothetical protein ACFC8N_11180 [Streptomyces sp. NPDC055966]|uniref:hypothetical protein n=1 Tax=Streptomyces sp. NPDC055966 TaxID=3345669 RepID=UPI0035E12EE0
MGDSFRARGRKNHGISPRWPPDGSGAEVRRETIPGSEPLRIGERLHPALHPAEKTIKNYVSRPLSKLGRQVEKSGSDGNL